MHPNAQLITRFYEAFAALDAETMATCYHPDVQFSDPAFPDLKGPEASGMWRMLCSRAKDFRLEFSKVQADESTGSAHWEARYLFSATGRAVHNRIDATFEFEDGLIRRHTDVFDFWTWSRQALGAPGLLLGWSGFLRKKVQAQAGSGLKAFLAKA